jgi:hypothetical protein
LEVEFTKPLRVGDGTQSSDYKIQQWFYTWTHEGESTQKRELENLSVRTVTLSEDRKKAFLEIDGMKEVHVLYVELQATFLSSTNDPLWSNEGWYTLNKIPDEAGIVSPYKFKKINNKLTPPELDEGWQSLFDGNSTQQWQQMKGSNWTVQNGHFTANGGSDLLATESSYDNFELEYEWKIEPGAEGGILFNIPNSKSVEEIIATSPRMQIMDDASEEAKTVHTHKTGALYDIQQPKYVVTKAANEYNLGRLVVKGNRVEHWVNGIKVLTYSIENQSDNAKIGLYSVRGKIQIRNVRIREL